MRKKILSIFLTIFMVMAFFPIKSQAATEYSLWVGGTKVTDDNKDDILGDGTCSFDPESNTLTLNNANITGAHSSSNIYVANPNISDLKISLKGTNSLSGQYKGVYSYYTNLTIDGSQGGTLEATGSLSVISVAYASTTIKNVDNLYAKCSGSVNGIWAIAGSSSPHALKIENSTVTAHSDGDGGIGIKTAFGPFIITGNSNVTASANGDSSKATELGDIISLGDGLGILEPTGGTVESNTIKNPDGTVAKRAVIGKQYDITTNIEPTGSGTVTSEGAYIDDHTVTLTAAPAEGYRFVNWTENGEEVSTDATYSFTVRGDRDLVANFAENHPYTIRFIDEDGTELQSSSVAYGETPVYSGETPTKEATEQYTYTFAGWSPEITKVTGDATYTATYTQAPREYTIKFTNDDDTELQSGSVAYGETPVYSGETPTKEATAQYTYNFLAWTPGIVPVTTDAVYKATYSSTVNKYTIKFVNEDGTELQSSSVPYGETPVYEGKTPTKEATTQYTYTFEGWSPEVTPVTGNATYTATYSSKNNTEHSKSESDDEETPKSDDSKAKESGISSAPNTGDQLNVLSYFALLTVSLICLIFIFLKKRIKKA